MSNQITHRPSGSMCQVCWKRELTKELDWACHSHFDFTCMKPIKTDKDGVIVVKCEEFKHEK